MPEQATVIVQALATLVSSRELTLSKKAILADSDNAFPDSEGGRPRPQRSRPLLMERPRWLS